MKKIIKFVLAIIVSIFISIICVSLSSFSATTINTEDYLTSAVENNREFKGLADAASGQKFFNDLVREASYLCAWHGGIFFNQKPIVIDIDIRIFYVNHKLQYTVNPGEEKWGYFEENPKHRAEFEETPFIITADKYKYYWVKRQTNESWDDITKVWESFGLKMVATQYSGDKYIESIEEKYGEEARYASVTSSGRTRYTPVETHYELNNQFAYLLSDCDDNARTAPRNSYVNVAFWHYLNSYPSTGTKNPYGNKGYPPEPPASPATSGQQISSGQQLNIGMSASDLVIATTATDSTTATMEEYLKKLQNGQQLTEKECSDIYAIAVASADDDVKAWNILKAINEYRSDPTNVTYIENLKNQLTDLTTVTSSNSTAQGKAAELIQNAQEFKDMWDEIYKKGTYEDTISDLTDMNSITVEYNATTQEYIVGPFTLEYMERYTRFQGEDIILAGMAGDPKLTVKINNQDTTLLRSGGEWDFYYKGPRIQVTEQGYTDYPHSNEQFYIKLKYQDGLNAIAGFETYFRYMQAEAFWSKSTGEIEQVKWKANFGTNGCNAGRCDGGYYDGADNRDLAKCHSDNNAGGEWHHHGSGDDHNMGTSHTNCSKYTAHYRDCEGHSHKSSCSDDCTSSHNCDKKCVFDHYTCDGHKCKTYENPTPNSFQTYSGETQYGIPCEHGFYGCHYSKVFFHMNGQYIGSVPIQYIATCHFAYRRYYDVTKKFDWNIDLTTMLEGDVWLDAIAQKDNSIMENGTGIKESSEHGVENVLVTIKRYQYNGGDAEYKGDAIMHDANGNPLTWPIKTDSNGHYKVDRIEAPGYRDGGSNCFYVAEFQYDGQVYESTIFLRNGEGDDTAQQFMDKKGVGYADRSLAVENATKRKEFDEKFTEIKGKSDLSPEMTTEGTSIGGEKDIQINYKGESKEDSSEEPEEDKNGAKMIRSKFESAATDDHENMKADLGDYEQQYIIKSYTYYNGSTEQTGANSTEYKIMFPMSDKGINYGAGEVVYTLSKNGGQVRYIDEYMKHINLGLQKRKESDISLLKDLYKVAIVVNEQEVVKNYNCLGDTTSGTKLEINMDEHKYQKMKEALEAERTAVATNKLGLYTSDVSYSSKSRYENAIKQVKDIKEGTELRVFATYAVRIYNDSDTNDVELNEIVDYFDDTYTLVDDDKNIGYGSEDEKISGYNIEDGIHTSVISDDTMERTNKLVADKPYYRIISMDKNPTTADISWKPTKQENLEGFDENNSGTLVWESAGETSATGIIKSKTTTLKDIKLKVNEYVEIFTTYEIDYKGYKDMRASSSTDTKMRADLISQGPGHKNNIAEVSNYSTYYSERDDADAIAKRYYKPYKNSTNISGKIDKDSAPDNVPEKDSDILNIDLYEDDTCRAIPLEIALYDQERQMKGYVFEDAKNKTETKDNMQINVGNGIFDGAGNGENDDKLVENVKVSMFEVISLAEITEGKTEDIAFNDLEYYYEVPQAYYNKGNEVFSNKNESNGGNYTIDEYLAGDYVLRFDYGTKPETNCQTTVYERDKDGNIKAQTVDAIKYNGQDYENTSFLSETTYGDGDGNSAINDKYLNLRKEDMKTPKGEDGIKAVISQDGAEKYSVARDNEARRMVVDAFSRTIENDRGEILRDRLADDELFIDATSMFAETPIMQIEISDPKQLNTDTRLPKGENETEIIKTEDSLVTTKEYILDNINFGLEQRAKTDIQLEEYIESIMLIKNNELIFAVTLEETPEGEWVVNKTNEGTQHLDKLTNMTRYEAGDTQQGFYAISIEDDYLNGLTMKIDYKIKIKNESEIDFTGELANYYVASEIVNKAKFSPTTEGYTEIINGWLRNEDAGLATNATLSEILRLLGTDSLPITSEDEGNINSGKISERDTIRPDTIVYGKYVGRFYYENKIDESEKFYTIKDYKFADKSDIQVSYDGDKVVKTTVNQLINYIDVNASYDLSTQNYENSAWDLSGNVDSTGRKSISSLDEIVSESSYREVNGVSNIYDEKDKALVTDVSSNIVISKNNKMEKFDTMSGKKTDEDGNIIITDATGINTYLTEELNENWVEYREYYDDVVSIDNTSLDVALVPRQYKVSKHDDTELAETEMWIMTTKTTASDTVAEDMSFDNLVEVLVYSNPTGRRDVYSVPGNAMAIATKEGLWKAGYNSKDYWNTGKNDGTAWRGDGQPIPDINTGIIENKDYSELASTEWVRYAENDAFAPEFVTIIAPTGITLRNYIKNIALPIAILIITVIAMAGVFGVKQIKIHKENKED